MSSGDHQSNGSGNYTSSSSSSNTSSDPLRNGAIFRLKRTDLGIIRSPGALVGGQLGSRQSPATDKSQGANASANTNTNTNTNSGSATKEITAEDIIKEKFDRIYRATPVPTALLGLDAGGVFGGNMIGNKPIGAPVSYPNSRNGSPHLASPNIGAYSPKLHPAINPSMPSPTGLPLAHLQQLQQQQMIHQQQLEQLQMRQHYQNISSLNQRSAAATPLPKRNSYPIDNNTNISSSPQMIFADTFGDTNVVQETTMSNISPGLATKRARSRTSRTRIGMVDSLMSLGCGAKSLLSSPEHDDSASHSSSSRGRSKSAPVQKLDYSDDIPSRRDNLEYDILATTNRSPYKKPTVKSKGKSKIAAKKGGGVKMGSKKGAKKKTVLRYVDSDSDSGSDVSVDEEVVSAATVGDGGGAKVGAKAESTSQSSTRSGRASVPVHRLIDSAAEGSFGLKRGRSDEEEEEEEDDYLPEGRSTAQRGGRRKRPEPVDPDPNPNPATNPAINPTRGGEMTLLYRVHSMTDPFAPDFWDQVAVGMAAQGGASLGAADCQKMWFNSLEEARVRQQKIAERKGLGLGTTSNNAVTSHDTAAVTAAVTAASKKVTQKRLAESAVIAEKEDDIFDYNSTIAQLVAGDGSTADVRGEKAVLRQFDDMASPASVHSESISSATGAIDAVVGNGSGSNAAWKVSYIQNLVKKISLPNSKNSENKKTRAAPPRARDAAREGGVSAVLDARGNLRLEVRDDDEDSD